MLKQIDLCAANNNCVAEVIVTVSTAVAVVAATFLVVGVIRFFSFYSPKPTDRNLKPKLSGEKKPVFHISSEN